MDLFFVVELGHEDVFEQVLRGGAAGRVEVEAGLDEVDGFAGRRGEHCRNRQSTVEQTR